MDQRQFICVYPPAPRVTDPRPVEQQMQVEPSLLGVTQAASCSLSTSLTSSPERLESSSIVRQTAYVNKVNAFVISCVNSSDISSNGISHSRLATVAPASVEGSPDFLVLSTSACPEQQSSASRFNVVTQNASFSGHSSNNGTQNLTKFASFDSTDWDEFFGDLPPNHELLELHGDDIIVVDHEENVPEESYAQNGSDLTPPRDPSPIVPSPSSVFDDVENSLTPDVERNLLAQLSTTPPKDIKLPDEPLSCYEPLLQVPNESGCELVSNPDFTQLEVMQPVDILCTSSGTFITSPDSPARVQEPEVYHLIPVANSAASHTPEDETTVVLEEGSVDMLKGASDNENELRVYTQMESTPSLTPSAIIQQTVFVENEVSPSSLMKQINRSTLDQIFPHNVNCSVNDELSIQDAVIGEAVEPGDIDQLKAQHCSSPVVIYVVQPHELPSAVSVNECEESANANDDHRNSTTMNNDLRSETTESVNEEHEKDGLKGQEKLPPYLRRCGDPDRKKGQNREAAQRYRSKKRSEVSTIEDKLTQLKARKEDLKQRIGCKKREADILEELIARKKKAAETNGSKTNNVTNS